MENQDIKNILITDTKYYIPNTSCGKYVKRKKLTLEDLLGSNYDKIHRYSQTHTRRQLETLVTMLRHVYLGENLPDKNIEQLDYNLSFKHMIDKSKITYNPIENLYTCNHYKKNNFHAFNPWGAIVAYNYDGICYLHLTDYFSCLSKDIEPLFNMFYKEEVYDKKLGLGNSIKFIDFFKWEKLKKEKCLYPYAKAYIDAYNLVFRKYDRDYNLRIEMIEEYERKYIELLEKLNTTEDTLLNLYKRVGLLPEDSSEDIDIKEIIKNRHN